MRIPQFARDEDFRAGNAAVFDSLPDFVFVAWYFQCQLSTLNAYSETTRSLLGSQIAQQAYHRFCILLVSAGNRKRSGTVQCSVNVTISTLESIGYCFADFSLFRLPCSCIHVSGLFSSYLWGRLCSPRPTAGILAPVLSLKCVGGAMAVDYYSVDF